MQNIRNSSYDAAGNPQRRDNVPVGYRKKRKKNLTLYYILVFALMVTALAVLSLTVFFNIDEISVLGSTVYTDEEIITSAMVEKGDNLFRTNIYELEENILNGLVNIEKVKVSRRLPSGLEISVTPCVATACIEYDGKYYTISRNGKILTNGLSQPESGLYVIKGFEPVDCSLGAVIESSDEHKKNILNQIISGIEECSFESIKTIDISDRLDIILNYDDRIEVMLGSALDLSYKISFSKAVIEQNNSDTFEGKLIMHGDSGASLIKKEDIT